MSGGSRRPPFTLSLPDEFWAWADDRELADALEKERCNGCGLPRVAWGPTCSGMTQGDWTHYHSPEWWRAHIERTRPGGDTG